MTADDISFEIWRTTFEYDAEIFLKRLIILTFWFISKYTISKFEHNKELSFAFKDAWTLQQFKVPFMVYEYTCGRSNS